MTSWGTEGETRGYQDDLPDAVSEGHSSSRAETAGLASA